MTRLLENLNPEQLSAVTLPAQPALILAGAGSGKTRVLTTRLAWLLQTGQISTQSALAVTFTNKAAKEMSARLSALLPINTRGMWIGTFHGLCNRLLRTHYQSAALPQTFQILDTQDQFSAMKRLLRAYNIDDEKFPPRQMVYFINSKKEEGLRAKDIPIQDAYDEKFVEIYSLYEEQCQREGVVDFAELLLRADELLRSNQLLREHYQQRFRHILVDEFQDTNNLQYRWLKLLAGGGASIFAVGDDDQSIYAFRGANVGNMASFEREFHVENIIRLEQNYRSHGHILDSANHLIAHNRNRLGKNLRTDAGHGEQLRVFEAPTDMREAQWVVEEIKNLIGEGMSRSEIAVLYRSNAQSRVLEHELFSSGIPYRVYGGLRFFERAEIKHALAYLQLIDNPHNDSAFLRVVNFPARGIGTRTLEHLQDAAKQNDISLYSAVAHVAGKAGAVLGNFIKLIESMRFETQNIPLHELVETVVHQSGLIKHYKQEKEGADRVENLEQLIVAAEVFVSEEGIGLDAPAQIKIAQPAEVGANMTELREMSAEMSPLSMFLSFASLESGENQAQAAQDAVQLMTVHSAKGLEFEAVFITGLEEGLFPHENSASEEGGLEEERRLMYVAITRAKYRLYLSLAQTRMLHGQTRYNTPSRFFDELPEDSLKWLTPRAGTGAGNGMFATSHTLSRTHTDKKQATGSFDRNSEWRIGESVRHPKFGDGVIVRIEGSGTNLRAQINFGKYGIKLLDLSVAKLEHI